jgi:hypothetical protein
VRAPSIVNPDDPFPSFFHLLLCFEGTIPMSTSTLFFAYFAPETLLPLTSIVATIAGIVMMLGRGSIRFILQCVRRGLRRQNGVAGVSHPHIRVRDPESARISTRS